MSYRNDVVQGQDLELRSRKRTSKKQKLGSEGTEQGFQGKQVGLGRRKNGRTGTGFKAQEGGSGKGRNPRDKNSVKDSESKGPENVPRHKRGVPEIGSGPRD